MKKQKIGFIGLGMMGKYMARNLLKKGYHVIGYNRSKQALNQLKNDGLKTADSSREVAEQTDIVILMLPSDKETKQVVFGKDGLVEGLRKGQVVIDMSTSNPIETKKIMMRLKKKGVTMMDAPVSRGQKAAVDGTLSIMVGGDKRAYNKCLPIFKAMGKYVVYLGQFGSGMYVKSLNNFLYAMNVLASSQGLAIMKKNNIDLRKAIEIMQLSSGDNKALYSIKRNLKNKKPRIGFYLKYMAKDMGIFDGVVKNQKVEHTLSKPILDFFIKMSKQYGEEDALYIFEHFISKK